MKTAKKRGRPAKNKEAQEQPVTDCNTLEVLVIKRCINPTMVEARLDGEKVLVRVPKRLHAKAVGKRIKVYSEPDSLFDGLIYRIAP